MKAHWITVGIASAILAILIKAVLHVPFTTMFVSVVTIYSMYVVLEKLGITPKKIETAWGWARKALNIGLVLVLCLVLRYIAAKVTNVYPSDTLAERGETFHWLLRGHNMASTILWEIIFALLAGGLAVAYVYGKGRFLVTTILVVSFWILSLQMALPEYTKTLHNRHEVSTNFVKHGTIGGPAVVLWEVAFGRSEPKPTPPPAAEERARTNPPPATRPVIKVGKQPTLHRFSDYADGCVSLKIEVYDFYWYPKGGAITVFPPKGESFVDTPGVDIVTHYEPGVWRWCAKDPGATGVEVWQ